MFSSFRIGTLFGITVRVHFLFLVMLLLVGPRIGPEGGPFGVLILLGLFGLVLLHELGHSLVAMRFGIRVMDITLWPLGGMARMSHIPEDTKTEALIAVAGPAVNFALLALALPLFLVIEPGDGLAYQLLFGFASANLMLGAFNLIPAFPMDGGRVLRALLGRNGDWVGATRKAVHVGRILAVFGGLLGFFATEPRIWLAPVIALWLWWVGGQELAAVKRRHAPADPLAGVAHFMRRAGFRFATAAGAAAAAQQAAGAAPGPRDARGFRTFGAAPFPGDAQNGAAAPPTPTPTNGAAHAEPEPRAPRARPGFSDDDVERLERFRGPLRQFRDDVDDA